MVGVSALVFGHIALPVLVVVEVNLDGVGRRCDCSCWRHRGSSEEI